MKTGNQEPARIGCYICHCGTNIAGVVDVRAVAEYAATQPGVVVARDYKYMCSDPGQELITKDIQDHGLNRIVVASCSPLLHEETFRKATAAAGVNPFFCHMVNVREHDAWVHSDRKEATDKARDLVRAALRRVPFHRPLEKKRVPVHPDVLVVGGGIAGIHAALSLAEADKKVYLVEREPTIGGHMAKFDKTFPTLDCAACILTPKMTAVGANSRVVLRTNSVVEGVSGYIGNFKVKVRRKARFVDEDKCTGCTQCVTRCPVQHKPYQPGDGNGNGRGHGLPVEPAMNPEMKAVADHALEKHRHERAPLITVLQDINGELRYLPEEMLRYVSRHTGIPLATVYHVATFYKAFSLTPRGEHLVRVCMGTACHVRGADRVLERLKAELEIGPGETTKDLKFTLETVNCLGTCAIAPVLTVGPKYHGTMRPAKVEKVLELYR
jgi:NADH:ubiquinone oxidoreductase subunit E/NAD-dependent dihydropyrimidine dehydrogenase PreA subunit